MFALADLMAVGAGGLVGLTLGLIGGGGSILAVPLLIYVVGIASPHIAIGTSAVAVAANALAGVALHARAKTVKWPCAVVFAAAGVVGAFAGARLGKAVDGELLLALFGLVMIAVGLSMLRRSAQGGNPDVRLDLASARALLPSLSGYGFAVGALSGFFGIGGGFLIVPGLINATAMPILNAVGSSLVSVAAFGAATAASYAASGLVDWHVAALLLGGGLVGALAGTFLARRLAARKAALVRLFAGVVILVGLYVSARGIAVLI
ncbi:MAG TPA: sulfite exporter TauE/SafE family protein [Parvibaculum sp.]|uniref:sulfite exporter TauE/SafE family protein n=1 Tax=Parvibaculum sp. TaxID=2024848 RepID=UPI002B8B5F9A|nr:sulfite exporter TauE/SafE family protein [Parvibaculum sp.]HMM13701.1 sulfite exporter TauE/SafE family protein [Parvibaculum sp.]